MVPDASIPDGVIDGVPLHRVMRSLLRRVTGRSKHGHVPGIRFSVNRTRRDGVSEVLDCQTGRTVRVQAPSELDAFTVREVFSERAYSLAGTCHIEDVRRIGSGSDSPDGAPLIIDAGANIGASTLLFRALYPSCRVVAIEPNPRNLELLRQNCADDPMVSILPCALGPTDGDTLLELTENPRSGRIGAQGGVRVQVISVPTLRRQYPGLAPFFLKIDIEGGELPLFAGPCGWIDDFPIICVEPHDWKWPGSGTIRPFLSQMTARNRDTLVLGENIVSIDLRLLHERAGLSPNAGG
jgi:FkbM family methyltransferase